MAHLLAVPVVVVPAAWCLLIARLASCRASGAGLLALVIGRHWPRHRLQQQTTVLTLAPKQMLPRVHQSSR